MDALWGYKTDNVCRDKAAGSHLFSMKVYEKNGSIFKYRVDFMDKEKTKVVNWIKSIKSNCRCCHIEDKRLKYFSKAQNHRISEFE